MITPLRYVINILCFFLLRELCFKLRERSYTRYDVYENYDCAISSQEFYMHGLMRIGKRRMLRLGTITLGIWIRKRT